VNLTTDEIIALIDCANNRIDDLENCAMFGDAQEIQGEIESLNQLAAKLEKEANIRVRLKAGAL
tara:strand:+ start:203 stop:394 length:192 start_codon:yes stop_codon:yes gene_type:complete